MTKAMSNPLIMGAATIAIAAMVNFSNIDASLAADPSIDAFINRQGGCALMRSNWEQQFRRRDSLPFEKNHANWTIDDYSQIRNWVVRCLDPFVAAPGRREFYLSNVDARLTSFQRTQQELLKRSRQQDIAEQTRREKANRVDELKRRVADNAQAALGAIEAFETEATTFNATVPKRGIAQIEQSIADGEKIEQLKKTAIGVSWPSRSAEIELRELGHPSNVVAFNTGILEGFTSTIKSLAALKVRLGNCAPALKAKGIPDSLTLSKVYAGSDQGDPYFFEAFCGLGRPATVLSYSQPGWFTKLHEFTVNEVMLSFELLTIPELGPRAMLKRLKVGSETSEAYEPWQSANLLQAAVILSAFRGFQ